MAAIRVLLLLFLFIPYLSKGNEGFWLPIHLERLRGVDLQKEGLHLTPEEIYSINSSSLKDAVVSFNGNCTGAIISKKGLLITNHHCGYSEVQQASTLKQNLLEEGFWASSLEDEVPTRDSYVSFLVRMEDVTEEVLRNIQDQLDAKEREEKIQEITDRIAEKAIQGSHYNAEVKSFFYGNEYYLFIYETFSDIRLVGTPPDNIGRFGGETDNWEWPSHTGDFALFRIYAGPNGEPATYASDNKPLASGYQLPISLRGVQDREVTMVMGYPAKTKRYTTSKGLKHALEYINPSKLQLLETRKELLLKHMKRDSTVRLGYASTLVELSNLEKYYRGQAVVTDNLLVIDKKLRQEEQFKWWYQKISGGKKYLEADTKIEALYRELVPLHVYNIFLVDGIFSSELLLFTYHFSGLYQPLAEKYPKNAFESKIKELQTLTKSHFKNYSVELDQELTGDMMELFLLNIPAEEQPPAIRKLRDRHKDLVGWSESLFKRSLFTDQEKVAKFLDNPKFKVLTNDPAFKLMRQLVEHYYGQVAYKLKEDALKLNNAYRIRQQGLIEMNPEANLYPEANGTLRISLGRVTPYFKKDEGWQPYQTTLAGLITKTKSQNPDYQVSEKLTALYLEGNFGRYGNNGDVPIAFITDNDISGGNSGSPVLNAWGELIGVVSDSNRDALAGDFYYDASTQRSVNIDIRYVLFIVDKFARATNLIHELDLADNSKSEYHQKPKMQHMHKID